MKTSRIVLVALGLICATPTLGAGLRQKSTLKSLITGPPQHLYAEYVTPYETNSQEIPEPSHAVQYDTNNQDEIPPPSHLALRQDADAVDGGNNDADGTDVSDSVSNSDVDSEND